MSDSFATAFRKQGSKASNPVGRANISKGQVTDKGVDLDAETLKGALGCMIAQLDLELSTLWEVGDVAICITPGSLIGGKEAVILTAGYQNPDKPNFVHMVDPGFPPREGYRRWGAERRHLRPLPDPNELSTWDE